MIAATPVLLPGNMCDARLWTDGVRNLLGNTTDADLTQDDSIAAMAARTLAASKGPLLPVGFSMGAIAAVEMWVQAPDRITGLVLMGYNATADLPERAARRPAQQAEVMAGGLERVLVEELKPNYLAAANRGNVELLALLRDMGMALGAEVFVRQSEALRRRVDRVAALGKIGCPVLYACGMEDSLCPPEWHHRWADSTPNAAISTMANAGHMLPLEQPTAMATAIADWVNTHSEELKL